MYISICKKKNLLFKEKNKYILANEFECGSLGFILYKYASHVSDFVVLFRRRIICRVTSASSFYSEDCFDMEYDFFF